MPNILIVDDEKTIRKIMVKMMSKYGNCETAESGSEALKKYVVTGDKDANIDLIVLDHSLDDMTGLEVLNKIRKYEKETGIKKEKRVKIIMATANKNAETVKACITAGCNHYILKPVKPATMKERLTQCGFLMDEQKASGKD